MSGSKTSEQAADTAFEDRHWRVQRIAWILMGLVIAAASAGFLGHGPASRLQKDDGGQVRLFYHLFERVSAPTSIEIELARARGDDTLFIGRDYLEAFEVTGTVPRAREEILGADGVHFVFSADETPGPRRITFDLESKHVGMVSGSMAAGGGAPISFRQFVLP